MTSVVFKWHDFKTKWNGKSQLYFFSAVIFFQWFQWSAIENWHENHWKKKKNSWLNQLLGPIFILTNFILKETFAGKWTEFTNPQTDEWIFFCQPNVKITHIVTLKNLTKFCNWIMKANISKLPELKKITWMSSTHSSDLLHWKPI